jgi:large subunit ribosomal protein L14
MILQQTIVDVSDNSGARIVRCIKILSGFNEKYATSGDIVLVAVVSLASNSRGFNKCSRMKKGAVYRALVIRSDTCLEEKDGTKYIFADNAVSLMDKERRPVGTKIKGYVSRNLKPCYHKFYEMSSGHA